MTDLLVSERFAEDFGEALEGAAREAELELRPVLLPRDPDARLDPEACEAVRLAFFSGDLFPDGSRAFFAAVHAAKRLEWMHVFNAGMDHPIFARLLERGIRLTNSPGAGAEPIAQSVIAALLVFARGVLGWIDAQRRHAWEPRHRDAPPDLRGQTLLVIGLGAIGSEVARLARALGLRTIGVRRSPARAGDPVDELHPPSRLADLLPRADWVVLACPLTEETRRIIGKGELELLRPGAHLLNVGRGELVDETALVEALRSGRLGGAYLDVFEEEPLPPGSPLWDLPNLLLSPHDAAAAQGNRRRQAEAFLRNLVHFGRGEPLENEVGRSS